MFLYINVSRSVINTANLTEILLNVLQSLATVSSFGLITRQNCFVSPHSLSLMNHISWLRVLSLLCLLIARLSKDSLDWTLMSEGSENEVGLD